MANSNEKGDRRERELTNWLDGNGWAVMRAPASGSATARELPDVLAGNGETFYAIEAKSSSGDPIYLTDEEVDALCYFAENFGAEARIAARFDLENGDPSYGDDDRKGWYFIPVGDLYETPGGNYRVKKELAHEKGVPEVEL